MKALFHCLLWCGLFTVIMSTAQAAVVYETHFVVNAPLNLPGLQISPVITATLPSGATPAEPVSPSPDTGGLVGGAGYFLVDGDEVSYFLNMSAFVATLDAVRFAGVGQDWLLPLSDGFHFYSPSISCLTPNLGNPFLPQPVRICEPGSYIDIVDEDGNFLERSYLYMSSPAIVEAWLYQGKVTDPVLAARLRENPDGTFVTLDGVSNLSAGSLTIVGTPEPGRSVLCLLGTGALIFRRRRVAFGLG